VQCRGLGVLGFGIVAIKRQPSSVRATFFCRLECFSCSYSLYLGNSLYLCIEVYAAFHMSALMSAGFGRFISLFFILDASCKQ